eukprot:8281004-Pyramimonas_sp.AAC.2
MVDASSGMQKNRLQVKKLKFCGGARLAYLLRPSSGHSGPGVECPELLCSRVTELDEARVPR